MFNIAIQYGNRYQLVIVSGAGGAAEFRAAHSFVNEWVGQTRCRRLLVDLLGVTSAMDAREKQSLSHHLQRTMPHYEKLAIVAHAAAGIQLIQRAAEARKVRTREFFKLEAAESWLMET
jgi:hypothetical protein